MYSVPTNTKIVHPHSILLSWYFRSFFQISWYFNLLILFNILYLNIYDYCRIYREANIKTNCLIKKYIYDLKLRSNFSKDVRKFNFKDYR